MNVCQKIEFALLQGKHIYMLIDRLKKMNHKLLFIVVTMWFEKYFLKRDTKRGRARKCNDLKVYAHLMGSNSSLFVAWAVSTHVSIYVQSYTKKSSLNLSTRTLSFFLFALSISLWRWFFQNLFELRLLQAYSYKYKNSSFWLHLK